MAKNLGKLAEEFQRNYTATSSAATVGEKSPSFSSGNVRDYEGIKYTTLAVMKNLVSGSFNLDISYDSNAYIVRLKKT